MMGTECSWIHSVYFVSSVFAVCHDVQDFYRKSVFETKYIFTLKDMDLRLMVSESLTPPEDS